jgi:flagellar basal body P-ring formation protein FlgA
MKRIFSIFGLKRVNRRIAFSLGLMGCAAASAPTVAGAAGRISVMLSPTVQVARPAVTLGDIAELSATDLQDLLRLMRLPLGAAPSAGRAVILAREDLAHWVQQRAGSLAGRIEWRGARTTEIRSDAQPVRQSAIVAEARRTLELWLAKVPGRSDVKDVGFSTEILFPSGEIELRARPLPMQARPTKRMQVWVDIMADGHFVRSVPIWFEVGVFQQAWVAKSDISTGSRIDVDAIEVRDVDITLLPVAARLRSAEEKLTATNEGMRARRSVRVGEPLTWGNCEKAPLMSRGEGAILRLANDTVTLESRVELLQDGYLGQLVRVKADHASGAILARVTGPGMVEAR